MPEWLSDSTLKRVGELIQAAANSFNESADLSASDSARLDAQLLLAEVLGKDRTWVLTWDDKSVGRDDRARFAALVERRIKGEPIAHILARREFWGLDFECHSSTLIPRPETELLVEKALELALPQQAKVLDLGTGTGAIALALASERPDWQISATDYSGEVVALAERNRHRLQFDNVDIVQSHWFESLEAQSGFDLILSNPPYVDADSPYLHLGDLRFEPKSALVADNAGMADIELICGQATAYLKPAGLLMIEHGFDQQAAVQQCLTKQGYTGIETFTDLAGLPRATLGVCAS